MSRVKTTDSSFQLPTLRLFLSRPPLLSTQHPMTSSSRRRRQIRGSARRSHETLALRLTDCAKRHASPASHTRIFKTIWSRDITFTFHDA